MTKEKYLRQLGRYLKRLPQDDYESAMQYFEEYFSDSGEENIQKIIDELGTPREAAKELLKNLIEQQSTLNNDSGHTGRKGRLLMLFLILASPVGMPIILILLIACFVGIVILSVVFLTISVYALVSLISGIRYIVLGIACVTSSLSAACTLIGAGLLESGIAICIGWLEIIICKGILKITGMVLERRFQKYISLENIDRKGDSNREME